MTSDEQKLDAIASSVQDLKQTADEHREELHAITSSVQDLKQTVDEHREEFRAALAQQREELMSYAGVLHEETNAKLDLIIEGLTALNERLDREIEEIRKEIEQLHLILFRKADIERLEVLERRVDKLEKTISDMK